MRVNLLHAHGTAYRYRHAGCRCISCRASKATETLLYRSTHRDALADQDRRYRAANPEKQHAYQRRYRRKHRSKQTERMRRWRSVNRELDRANARNWRSENLEKARACWHNHKARRLAAPGHHSAADVQAQYERQKGRCFWGRSVNPGCAVTLKRGYHVDHVIPLAGGRVTSNGPDNIVLACPSCNLRKGAKDPMDFAGVLF